MRTSQTRARAHTHTHRLLFKWIDNRRNLIQALSYMCPFIEKHLKITTELECSIGEPIRDIDANSYTGRRRVLVINPIELSQIFVNISESSAV